jgi:hypothetical protein
MWANCNPPTQSVWWRPPKVSSTSKESTFFIWLRINQRRLGKKAMTEEPNYQCCFLGFVNPKFTNNERMKSQRSKHNTEPLPHIERLNPGDPQTTTQPFTRMWPKLHTHQHNDHWKAMKTPSSNQKPQGPMITPRPISDLNNPALVSENNTC